MKDFDLYNGDCLEVMKEIPDGSVDMVLTDPPYGTTVCKWDTVIDIEEMWSQLKRIIKPTGAIVMTASQPFSSALIMSNPEMFKYSWVWEKNRPAGVAQAKNKPMTIHEDILVFSDGVTVHKSQSKRRMPYNPQGLQRIDKKVNNSDANKVVKAGGVGKRPSHKDSYTQEFTNYPNTVLKFNVERGFHPTQKPVSLMEYLIKTYTNEDETVLDFTMGSGTTGVASKNLNRKFIGIELDEEYFEIARERILEG